jgi:hypothetical protein
MAMELKALEAIRQAGVIDEYQLASILNLSQDELRSMLTPLVQQGYVTVITKHGRDCLSCDSRFACPGSRIHSVGPDTAFSAYRLTSAGMRYRRHLLTENEIK